jgi:hypothetical protein
MGIKGLTRAQHRAMEMLWEQELGMRRPFPLHPRVEQALLRKGYIEVNDVLLPGRVPATIKLVRFSLAGHHAITMWESNQY